MFEIKIDEKSQNQRVDKYVRKLLNDAPLSFIYKTFRKKDVKINGHWVDKSYILKANDVLTIYIKVEQLEEFKKPKAIEKINHNLDIIYEDENILIVNKPQGILVHGDISEKRKTLSNEVLAYLYSKGEYKNDNTSFIPSPVHRLDRNTSGLVIFAKNILSSQQLMDLLKTRDGIEKYYQALVSGKTPKEGTIDAPLYKNPNEGLVRVDFKNPNSKSAITKYKIIEYIKNYSLVEIELLTGRTHQIRAHFNYINHPLVGDGKYGNYSDNKFFHENFKYDYQFLHAYRIKFKNIDGHLSYLSNKEFKIPLTKRQLELLNKLRNI